jgi:flagellar hook-associated protein 3 FlgL
MRISTAQLHPTLLGSISQSYSTLNELAQQIGTNKKLLRASDDPIGAVQLMGLRQENRMETQYDTMTNMLDRMQELTLLAANGTNSADDLKGIADEMDVLKEGLLAAVNQRDENGSSLFAGSHVSKTALEKDPVTGSYIYNGDSLEKQVMVGSGVTVSIGQGADKLFLDGGDYFKGIDDLIDGLRNNDPSANSTAGALLTQTKQVQTNISSAQGLLGSKQNLMEQMSTSHIEMTTYSQEVVNNIETLELPDALSKQAETLVALQVQQKVFSQLQGLSLFNYL